MSKKYPHWNVKLEGLVKRRKKKVETGDQEQDDEVVEGEYVRDGEKEVEGMQKNKDGVLEKY